MQLASTRHHLPYLVVSIKYTYLLNYESIYFINLNPTCTKPAPTLLFGFDDIFSLIVHFT